MIICANIKSIKQNKMCDGWLSMKKREQNLWELWEKKMAAAIFWPANRYMCIYFVVKILNL